MRCCTIVCRNCLSHRCAKARATEVAMFCIALQARAASCPLLDFCTALPLLDFCTALPLLGGCIEGLATLLLPTQLKRKCVSKHKHEHTRPSPARNCLASPGNATVTAVCFLASFWPVMTVPEAYCIGSPMWSMYFSARTSAIGNLSETQPQ